MPNDTYVALPDGSYVQVPDNASPGDIQALKVKLAASQRPSFASTLANINRSVQAFQQMQGSGSEAAYQHSLGQETGPEHFASKALSAAGLPTSAEDIVPWLKRLTGQDEGAKPFWDPAKQAIKNPTQENVVGAVPIVGPMAVSMAKDVQKGDYTGAAGTLAGAVGAVRGAQEVGPGLQATKAEAQDAATAAGNTVASKLREPATLSQGNRGVAGTPKKLPFGLQKVLGESNIPKGELGTATNPGPLKQIHTITDQGGEINLQLGPKNLGKLKYTMNDDGTASVTAVRRDALPALKGKGTEMYEQAAFEARKQGATALTSDLKGSTSFDAAQVWEKLMKRHPGEVVKFINKTGSPGYKWDLTASPESVTAAHAANTLTGSAGKPFAPLIFSSPEEASAFDQRMANLKQQASAAGTYHAAQGSTSRNVNLQQRIEKKFK